MLDTVKKANEVYVPQKIVAYGVQGIGKTTFGATFESPILLPIEEGAAAIEVESFPLVSQWQSADGSPSIIGAIEALHGDHNYKTLVVDSLDWLEPLVWQAVCEAHGKSSIEDFGYGKGYVEAQKWWTHFMQGLDSLRRTKGMDIVLLAHSEIKRHEPPDSDPYDRYQLRLHRKAFALWQEWADLVLFLNYRVNIKKDDKGFGNERTRGVGTGERVIFTSERPAYDAKNRWKLPEEILVGKDATWGAFHEELSKATSGKYVNPIKPQKKK